MIIYKYIQKLKRIIKIFIPSALLEWKVKNNWKKSGFTIPPPHQIKQLVINNYRKKSNIKIFIETGTYFGDMIEAQRNNFNKIFSIELSQELYANAKKRFKNYKHIEIFLGDSSSMLKNILEKINEPAIFWLDGHYSGEGTAIGESSTPILGELEAIFKDKIKNHIILIDDARCFNGSNEYPTINFIKEFVKKYNSNLDLKVKYDIIIIHEKNN